MYNFKFSETLVALGFWLLLQIFILPVGCSTAPGPAGADAGSPALPGYELGTTYVYSNGSWETVADISPQSVTWHDHRGNVYHRSPDFTYRPVSWETGSRQGRRQIVPRSDALVHKSASLWPLQKGNQASFTEMVTSHKTDEPVKTYRVNWTCEVNGKERIAVMVGEFDTWKITCNRYNNFQNPSKASIKETRTWNYAPEVKHYVLTERLFSGGKAARRLELLAILPPLNGLSDLARRQMRNAFQMALENKRRGESATWSTPNTSGSGRITPLETFKLADGRYSRRYTQKILYPDGQRIYYGLAVRSPNGRWIIPRR
jgi:hypothetical protein